LKGWTASSSCAEEEIGWHKVSVPLLPHEFVGRPGTLGELKGRSHVGFASVEEESALCLALELKVARNRCVTVVVSRHEGVV